MLMLTVLTLFVVMVTYMALAESLATVIFLICAPLPLGVWLSLMQLVTVSFRPPYHLTTLLTVESAPFITDHIAPRVKVALTYLKQTPASGTEYEPPPVMTVGVAHRLLLGVGDGPGVFVGVFVGTGVLVGVFDATGVFVGVLLATGVFVGVFDATGVLVGVFEATGVLVNVFVGAGVLVGPPPGSAPQTSAPLW